MLKMVFSLRYPRIWLIYCNIAASYRNTCSSRRCTLNMCTYVTCIRPLISQNMFLPTFKCMHNYGFVIKLCIN